MLEGKKGNGAKEIHDAGGLRALGIENGHHGQIVTGKTHVFVAP